MSQQEAGSGDSRWSSRPARIREADQDRSAGAHHQQPVTSPHGSPLPDDDPLLTPVAAEGESASPVIARLLGRRADGTAGRRSAAPGMPATAPTARSGTAPAAAPSAGQQPVLQQASSSAGDGDADSAPYLQVSMMPTQPRLHDMQDGFGTPGLSTRLAMNGDGNWRQRKLRGRSSMSTWLESRRHLRTRLMSGAGTAGGLRLVRGRGARGGGPPPARALPDPGVPVGLLRQHVDGCDSDAFRWPIITTQ